MTLRSRSGRDLSAIPEPPRDASPALKAMLAAMKEALEVRLGRRGDPLDEAVTKRELIDSGVAKRGVGAGVDLAPVTVTPGEARIVPPVPIGFVAEGVFGGVHLTWENPFQAYNVHALTEVWRGESNDPTARVLINSSRGTTFFDRIADEDAREYWYWVRFVSEYNREGPFSLPFRARKEADVREVMERISGEINQSDLASAFAEEVAQLKASYVVKLDNNGYAAGFGLYNTGAIAEFAVWADRFSVGRPGMNGVKPFIVDGNRVYIDSVLIRDASIQQGKLGPISFGKIIDAAGNPVTTLAGKLRADAIDVASLQVTDANIAGVLRSNQVGANGQPRWMLDKNGGMTLNSTGAGGRMEVRDNVIKVFDQNGVLRVQLGNLTA